MSKAILILWNLSHDFVTHAEYSHTLINNLFLSIITVIRRISR